MGQPKSTGLNNQHRLQIYKLKQNQVILEATQNQQIAVIGAYYEISSGAVDFIETEADLRLNDGE